MTNTNSQSPDVRDQIGPAPSVPPGFWGDVTFRFQDGKAVFVEVKQSFKPVHQENSHEIS